ncbi:Electron transport complex protein rnfE [Anaerobiospirillum thomasii]|uniref:Ion-translocating oxidoreductase complex subunit E n=2 Tax=Anaerobiospirillum thomasii TaxID=179995 RepID=A0A2X0VBU0_9GAMM|nr:electron transport complex subunit E [Anaerobiospirillum thomasii]SPT70656.1 Electron transport complex protein rnfE [Anaerobiospirillum thomasii]
MKSDHEFIEGQMIDDFVPAKKKNSLFSIIVKGIWKENPGLCQLLGLCPLLAVTSSASAAMGLGIATIVVMMASSLLISLMRRFILKEVRIPLYVVLIATLVTVVKFEVEAYFPELYESLGIYLSLIVTNCIIMGRAEAFAGRNGPIASTVDAFASGLGFAMVLFALGSVREIFGSGTWFMGAADILGPWAQSLETRLIGEDFTYIIAILPPGGFFVLALLIALKNAIESYAKNKEENKFKIKSIKV